MLRHCYSCNYRNLRAVPFLLSGLLALVTAPGSARAETLYGFGGTTSPILYSFNSATTTPFLTTTTLSGLLTGHSLRAIDFRPSDGQLYALSSLNSTTVQLYTVNLSTGALTTVGNAITTLTGGTGFSMDFDPVADTLRVIATTRQSFRINPTTGTLIQRDTNIAASGFLSDIAYSNNVAGTTSSTLYTYDTSNNQIGRIGSVGGTPNSPNNGSYTIIGGTGFSSGSTTAGFDISSATETAYISNNRILYTVNLSTGQATSARTFTVDIEDIAVPTTAAVNGPEPATFALLALGTLAGGVVIRRRKA